MKEQFDVLYEEAAETGLVMNIGLHPHVAGVPHRIRTIREFLRYAKTFDNIWWPSREELVSRARAIAEGIRERAGKTEQDRVLPAETYQEFKDSGLLRAFVPRAFGGYALGLPTVIETSREISRVCGSSSNFDVEADVGWA